MKNIEININEKYISKNPISRYLVSNFNKGIEKIIFPLQASSILDMGCGEGIIFSHLGDLIKEKKCVGLDIDEKNIIAAKKNVPGCEFNTGDIYNIAYPDRTFELVICTEVLEHLEYPGKAINELIRVSSKYVLISVPREPVWRIMNMVRLKYWSKLGNTPGHINHWSSRKIAKMISQKLKIIKKSTPLPWTIICGVKE
ncbi:MAG: class I SAM-dependent methyltransferase [Bacteroidales bacterium]|nr:class I SAM-dependent methyltransferase [Bacteroidales bacterium]